jgi:serine/threonine protein kinase
MRKIIVTSSRSIARRVPLPITSKGVVARLCYSGGRLSEEEAMVIIKGIVSGCKLFHEKGVVHRDLKPTNILMKAGVPKISDFGYCEIVGSKKPRVFYNVGSPSYMPPEAYIKNYYSEKSDVWAVGMIYYEMLKGNTVDKGKEISEIYNFVRTGGRFVPPGVSPQSERILL